MKNLIIYLFSIMLKRSKCSHSNALLYANEGYCPDCGIYLKKYYYVLRCNCCNHKREANRTAFGRGAEIIPVSKYCPVCGGAEYYIEKYEKLNLVDINYAIEVKEEYDILNSAYCGESSTKVWVEPADDEDREPYQRLSLPLNSVCGLLKAGSGLPLT